MELREKLKPAKHFTNLLNLLSSSKFLNMEGLGIEIPFYIYPFSPKETVQIYTVINNLITQLKQRGIIILEINLYLASLEILKERGILPWILENETQKNKKDILELLQNVLDPEKYLIPYLEKCMSAVKHQILFVTGVGEVFPYLRLHSILSNMERIPNPKPSVFFFPGEYDTAQADGATLRLFGIMENKHYRAFNIYDWL